MDRKRFAYRIHSGSFAFRDPFSAHSLLQRIPWSLVVAVGASFTLERTDRPFDVNWVERLGLVISPRTDSSFLGYERTTANAPVLLAQLMHRRHRGTFLAAWEDVARVGEKSVHLRPRYTKYSAVLRNGGV